MEVKEIINIMSDEDVINILNILGSAYPKKVNDGWLFQTICHNAEGTGKYKLHYHSESKTFFCYTHCGSIGNIFNLVKEVRGDSFKAAYNFICDVLGFNTRNVKQIYGFQEEATDNSFIKKFAPEEREQHQNIKIRDKNVLKEFWELYHQKWIDDNISKITMKKFNIKYDLLNNAIIIPHFNQDGELIGIRARNLNDDMIEEGKKYMPIIHNGELYNYPTGLNLYGLNVTEKAIRKYKRIIIGEGEKFVMQHYSYYGENSVAVALGGSSISDYQIQLIKDLGVETITLALDKEFDSPEAAKEYAEKIKRKFIKRLYPYFSVEILWDNNNFINLKDSPTDKGKEIFEQLYKNRIIYKG